MFLQKSFCGLTELALVMACGITDPANTSLYSGLLPDDTKPLPEWMLTYHE